MSPEREQKSNMGKRNQHVARLFDAAVHLLHWRALLTAGIILSIGERSERHPEEGRCAASTTQLAGRAVEICKKGLFCLTAYLGL
jgi:hypothetical protein